MGHGVPLGVVRGYWPRWGFSSIYAGQKKRHPQMLDSPLFAVGFLVEVKQGDRSMTSCRFGSGVERSARRPCPWGPRRNNREAHPGLGREADCSPLASSGKRWRVCVVAVLATTEKVVPGEHPVGVKGLRPEVLDVLGGDLFAVCTFCPRVGVEGFRDARSCAFVPRNEAQAVSIGHPAEEACVRPPTVASNRSMPLHRGPSRSAAGGGGSLRFLQLRHCLLDDPAISICTERSSADSPVRSVVRPVALRVEPVLSVPSQRVCSIVAWPPARRACGSSPP